MGRRANPTVIGAFIIGAVVLIVMGLLIFGRGHFFSETQTFVSHFDGSVKGLNVGAPVKFQGVRVDSVTDIKVQYLPKTNEFRTPVYIQIETNRIERADINESREVRKQSLRSLIDRGLRAWLEVQSLVTGQLIVQLGFYPDTPIRLIGEEADVPEMPTILTTLQQAQAAAQSLLERIEGLPLDQLFANMTQTIEGINRLVNAPEVFELAHVLNETMTDVQRLVRQVDGQMGRLLDDVGGASAASRTFVTDLQQFMRRLEGGGAESVGAPGFFEQGDETVMPPWRKALVPGNIQKPDRGCKRSTPGYAICLYTSSQRHVATGVAPWGR